MNKTKTIYNTIRSAKFVLKPTVKQKEILESFFGLSRTIYNISLYNIKNSKFGTYEIQNGKNKVKYQKHALISIRKKDKKDEKIILRK